jgi:Spx/MgsR family transcriptional regulator
MISVYGIPNCDIVKKTKDWFDEHHITYHFHNYKTEGIAESILERWCSQKDWQLILNKRSTTWKELTPKEQDTITNKKADIKLMTTANSIIKRPIIEQDENLIAIGFDENTYKKIFNI